MTRSVILAEGLRKVVPTAAGELVILDGIDLEINEGESVAITGASGSGKTTLLGILAGLDTASEGVVRLMDAELSSLDEEARALVRGQCVGFVFQSFHLLANLTALENVMLPLELQASKKARQVATDLLNRVGLGDRLQHYPNQLSGGEQQRVAIARAFVTSPAIVFADEPTGNLDAQTGRMIIELLFEMNHESNTTLIMVTHDENLASQCQRTFVLENGVITENVSE